MSHSEDDAVGDASCVVADCRSLERRGTTWIAETPARTRHGPVRQKHDGADGFDSDITGGDAGRSAEDAENDADADLVRASLALTLATR